VEVQDDLGLLEREDLLPEALPPHRKEALDREFPPTVATPNGTYPVSYDTATRRVVLEAPKALAEKPVAASMLPRWPGWEVVLRSKGRERRLRGR
jgi:hypothetical protein